MAEERVKRKLAAIVSADVVGWSRLMGEDEAGTLATLKRHRGELIDPKIAEYGGRIVSTAGDSVLVEYPSAVDAVRCSIEIQQAMAERNADLPDDKKMVFRVGVNLGDVIIDGDDVFGDGVNVAARLQALAEPGGVCLSEDAHRQVEAKLAAAFDDLGERRVKNIAQPIRVYALRADQAPKQANGEASALPLPAKPSIAVLPFDNMSGDPEQGYFGEGIAEDIITDLSKISDLFVIARNSSFAYKGTSRDVRQVCRELGVRYVLEGSVRKASSRVRINAQLIDGTSGGHLWAERYDRDLTDIFAVQDEVTGSIVSALKLRLSAGEKQRIARQGTDSVEAYDRFLRARADYFRFTKESNVASRLLFERAVEIDPGYGDALVGVAQCHLREWTMAWTDRPEESVGRAIEIVQRAIDIDDSLPEAYGVLGFARLWQRRHDDAIDQFKRVFELDANNAMAHAFFSITLSFGGRPNEGLREAELALRLDPRETQQQCFYDFALGLAHLLGGRYPEAREALARSIAIFPYFTPPHFMLSACYTKLDRPEEARAEAAEVLALNRGFTLRWAERALPFRNAEDQQMVIEAARAAGIPE